MEVFRATLILMGRGDEGIDTGVRTSLGGRLRQLVARRSPGWHRVVSSNGELWDGKSVAAAQLGELRREGARPKERETVRAWATRMQTDFVGCYKSSKGRQYAKFTECCLDTWPVCFVEAIPDKSAVRERLRLSGGKLFHHEGDIEASSPAFYCDPSRKPQVYSTLPTARAAVSEKVLRSLTISAIEELTQNGVICLRRLLKPQECAGLLSYAESARFNEEVRLTGEAGQGGSYHFGKSFPPLVDALREVLYKVLVGKLPEVAAKFGKDLASLEKACRASGQTRCASIFLAFGEGGMNLAHQDPYGKLFFPYQAMLMLSRRDKDFSGGEFFVKNVKTGSGIDVAAGEGDLTLFAANSSAIRGADFKHGVRPMKRVSTSRGSCERFSIGVVFNLRK